MLRLETLRWCEHRADYLVLGVRVAHAAGCWGMLRRRADDLAAVAVVRQLAVAERDGDRQAVARLEREARRRALRRTA